MASYLNTRQIHTLARLFAMGIVNPMTYLVISLLPFLWYFSHNFHWWTKILVCQLLIGFLGLWVRSWRLLALFLLTFLSVFYLPWYLSPGSLPEVCQKQTDSITGVVKAPADTERYALDLVKVRVWCRDKSAVFPLARVSFQENAFKRLKWFNAGEEVELRNVSVQEMGRWGVGVSVSSNVRAYSLSFQQSVLSKSELFIYLRSRARYYLDDFSLGVFRALAMADRSSLSREWKSRFRDLGVMHIFAISGMHIGIIFIWLTMILRRSLSLPLNLVERGRLFILVDLLSLGAILLFVDLIGAPISSKRAVIMLCWYLLNKHLLYLQPLWFVLLGVAGYVLVEQPSALGQISFQLSFLSVAAILSILSFLPVKFRQDSPVRKLWKTVVSIFFISAWILLVTLPVLNTLNREWSLLSPVNNIFHILVMSFVLLPLILMALVVSIMGYYAGVGLVEFYAYAFVDYALKGWEWCLLINHDLNRIAMWEPWVEWSQRKVIVYWLVLIGAIFLLRLMLKVKKKTNVHFCIDRFTHFFKNAVVHIKSK